MARTFTINWNQAALWLLRLLSLCLIAGTLLSTTDLNQWWIRVWDFPRVQILIAMVSAAIALWFLDRRWRPWGPLILVGLSVWQLYRIHPYTPIAETEVARTLPGEADGDGCFTVLTLNVLQTDREYQRTADLIRDIDPDILLLTETDQAWADAMAPIMAEYSGRIDRPLSNTYGLMFATRLPMKDATIQELAEKDTPSVFATLMAGRREFRVIGLHPRPPTPGQDTEERDAEIVIAARQSRDLQMPVLAIGDFNDVAWSDTTSLFLEIGSFLDPRIGRGTYATFPADKTWLGWPLDHLFVTEEFLLEDMSVGAPVGSDHRPVIAQLCLAPAPARTRNDDADGPSAEDERDAAEVMEEFEEDSAKDQVRGE
jgi:endonuclease/exonuclease/phosphatase (EEP) superfamily protein YafD|tara:strand:+ start:68821 stop:69933 length:1113 start_codon:yes stop_codon:yes gene_type:complete